VQSGALAAPALSPVGLELGGFGGVGEGIVPLAVGGVGDGAVAVEDVVVGLEQDGLGKLVTGRMSII